MSIGSKDTPAQPPPSAPPGQRRPPLRRRPWGATFAALSQRDFAWYFAGNTAFFMGMQMQMILRGFLAFELTNAATALGFMSVSIAVPMLLVAPFGGVVADRVNKRSLLIVTQSVSAVSSLIIAFLILTDLIEFWQLLVMSSITGVVFSFNMPARQALVPQLVPRHLLMNAISLQMGGMNLTRILAPALAGLLINPLGVGIVYLFTFVLFIIAVASEFHLPIHGMVAVKSTNAFRKDMAEGFRYIRGNRTISLLLFLGLAFPLFGFPVQQMLPVFAEDVFDKGPSGLGILAASTGVGGLIGALIAANLDRVRHKGRLMLVGGVWMGGLFIAFTQSPSFAPAIVFLAMGNIGGMIFQTTNNSVIQARLPDEVRGRVMSVMMMSFGLMPLGVLPVTVAADEIGARTAVAVSSAMLIAAMLITFALSRRLRTLKVDPFTYAELSPVQAAQLVAEGKLSAEDAKRRTSSNELGSDAGDDAGGSTTGDTEGDTADDDAPPLTATDSAPRPIE